MWSRKYRWSDGLEAEFQIVEDNYQDEYDQVSIRLIVSTPEFRKAIQKNGRKWIWSAIGGNGSPKALLWARKQLAIVIDLIGDQVAIRVAPSDYRRGQAYYQTLVKAGFECMGDEFIRFPKPNVTDH